MGCGLGRSGRVPVVGVLGRSGRVPVVGVLGRSGRVPVVGVLGRSGRAPVPADGIGRGLGDADGGFGVDGFDTGGWGLFGDEDVGRGLDDADGGLGADGFGADGFDTCGGRDVAGVAPDGFDFDADDLESLDDDDFDDDGFWASTGSDQPNVKAIAAAMASLFKTCGEKHAVRYVILFMMI